jgi:hypothetical protein
MSGCGIGCILLLWTIFLWPLIVSFFYLILKRKSIISKGKFFLLSSLIGYTLTIGVSVLMNFLKDITEITEFILNSTETQQSLIWWFESCILFLPTIVSSHLLARKYS